MRLAVGVVLSALGLVAAGCMANPGPPPVVDGPVATADAPSQTAESTPASTRLRPHPERPGIVIGVDELGGGLNPHMKANNSALVMELAQVVLPSVFEPTGDLGEVVTRVDIKAAGQPAYSSLLTPDPSVPISQIRYRIAPEAQWSDGTPITGADFHYLWRNMVSSPGVRLAAGYQAISQLQVSDSGRVVTVEFSQPVTEWDHLFRFLLPSHLLEESTNSFAEALSDGIPAAAGRFAVERVDRARGRIILNRNDRYWGSQPAELDIIELRFIRDAATTGSLMRSGQLLLADITPAETTAESLELLPHLVTGYARPARQLQLSLVAHPDALPELAVRRELASIINTEQLARLATGRSHQLAAAPMPSEYLAQLPEPPQDEASTAELRALRARAELRPIRVAADPTEPERLAAGHALVSVLASHQIPAELVSVALTTRLDDPSIADLADIVVTWEDTRNGAMAIASTLNCQQPADTRVDPEVHRGFGISGYCPAEARAMATAVLSGQRSVAEGEEYIRQVNSQQALIIPLFSQTRLRTVAADPAVVMMSDSDIAHWPGVLPTAASLKLKHRPSVPRSSLEPTPSSSMTSSSLPSSSLPSATASQQAPTGQ